MSLTVLFIALDLPMDDASGGQIATWRLLESYSSFATVDLIALTPEQVSPSDELLNLVRQVNCIPMDAFHFSNNRLRLGLKFIRAQIGSQPYRQSKFDNIIVRELVRQWSEERQYDLIHCDQLSTAPYASTVPDTPAILVEQNVEWQTLDSMAKYTSNPIARSLLRREARRTGEWELRSIEELTHTLTLSHADRNHLVARRPEIADRISVWPVPAQAHELYPTPKDGKFRLLVLGSLRSMGRLHGLRWFLHEVWPTVRQTVPDAELHIVGADPPSDVQKQHGTNGLYVHGFLQDLESILPEVTVCVIPLFVGAGIRIKLIELIARGIPCLGTSIGVQGLNDLSGVITVEGADAWVSCLVEIAHSSADVREAAQRGASQLSRDHSPQEANRRLQAIVEQATGLSCQA